MRVQVQVHGLARLGKPLVEHVMQRVGSPMIEGPRPLLAPTGGPVSDRSRSRHVRGCSGGRVRDPLRPGNSRLLAIMADRPAVEPRAGVDHARTTRRVVNQRRADLVLISEDPDRFVQGGIMLQLRWKKMMVGLLRWGCAA